MSVAWVGAGVAAVGAYSNYSSQQDQLDYNQNLTDEDRQAAQNTHDEWQATYGELAGNLSEYYNSISAESYAAMGLENSAAAFETSMKRINESLAQRGITNTAVGASITAQAELGQAEERAAIRSTSETLAMQEKLGFLQLGLSQDQGKDYGMNSTTSSVTAGTAETEDSNSDYDGSGSGSNSNSPSSRGSVNYTNYAPVSDVTNDKDINDTANSGGFESSSSNRGDWGA